MIVITNQSAVGRGLISAAGLAQIHRRMCAAVAAHGGRIRDIFFCPHRPADRCRCRKPRPGLILRARQIHGIDLTTAIMVGDSVKDIACARSAGCRCALLVHTGNGLRAQRDLRGRNLSPDQMCPDLFQAAEWIIRRVSGSTSGPWNAGRFAMNSPRATIRLEGQVDHITHANAATHYTVAHLSTTKTHNRVTITGIMPGIKTGETLRIEGTWETHPRFGLQFRVQAYTVTLPATVEGIRHYLAAGIVKGIGPFMAHRIVEHFGAQTLAVIEADPQKLQEVEGIGQAKAALIARAWKEHHTLRELIRLLQDFGLQAGHAPAILQAYGGAAEDVLRSDPYRLVRDIPAIGFQAAEAVSRRLCIDANDPRRLRAVVRYLLQLAVNEGHTYFPEDQLLARGEDLFQIDPARMAAVLKSMAAGDEIVVAAAGRVAAATVVYLKELHQAECGIARRLEALLSVPVTTLPIDAERIAAAVHHKLAIRLSDEQLAALAHILAHRVVIITGGPGTGKTTLIRSIGAVFDAVGQTCLLAAPTGRAARRLEEVAGREARTLHRLLGYNFNEDAFEHNPDDPLRTDAVVVDEASMVDVPLMFHLLQAVPMTARLILVGDVFQLPSVGPGNVLADLIASKCIKQVTLTQIFRQDRESAIVRNAHRIHRGSRRTVGI